MACYVRLTALSNLGSSEYGLQLPGPAHHPVRVSTESAFLITSGAIETWSTAQARDLNGIVSVILRLLRSQRIIRRAMTRWCAPESEMFLSTAQQILYPVCAYDIIAHQRHRSRSEQITAWVRGVHGLPLVCPWPQASCEEGPRRQTRASVLLSPSQHSNDPLACQPNSNRIVDN